MNKTETIQEEQALNLVIRRRASKNFLTFVRGLIIPSATGPQLFENCIADYQLKCFKDLSSSLAAVQKGEMPKVRRFWWERTKKAGKDSDISLCLLWLIAFAQRPLYLQVGAADKDQAGIVKRRMTDVLFYNKWLGERVEEKSWHVGSSNGLATLDILAADVAGSHGETPDVLVVNELSHVTKWEFVENLLDNADGVPQGIVIVATNAGFKGTKAEVLRRNAMESEEWYFHRYDQPAPWIRQEDIEDAKARNSRARFLRLWKGVWASGKGDALDEEDIDRCLGALPSGSDRHVSGTRYLGGLDLGVSHDHAGFVVVGVNEKEQKIDVVRMESWEPAEGPNGEVDLSEVERACFQAFKQYRLDWLGYDPSQAKLMAQRLSKRGVPMHEVTFTGGNLTAMAESLMQVTKSGALRAYEDERLRRDFGKFSVVEKSYGYKLEAVSDEYGHADVGTALVITLPRALDTLRGRVGGLDPDEAIGPERDEEELSEAEIEEMPQELREIYEMGNEERQSRIGEDW